MRVGSHGGHPGISGGCLLVQFLAGAGRARLQHGSDLRPQDYGLTSIHAICQMNIIGSAPY